MSATRCWSGPTQQTAGACSPCPAAWSGPVCEIPAEHLGLRQRQQQPTHGQATIPLLDCTDRVIERGEDPEPVGELSNRDHPRHRRQRRVRSTDTNPTSQPTYALHRTGAFLQQLT
jgi:hypothetical protein